MSTRHVATLREQPVPLIEGMAECGGYALDTYRWCDLHCVYCITGAPGTSTPRCGDDELLPRLRAALGAIPADSPLFVGALCDAYPLAEEELGFTRRALAELARQHRSFIVVTKGATVVRDIDLFLEAPASVTVSLCTVDGEALRRVDPKAPGVDERLAIVRTLREAGVEVRVSAAPWIPDVSDVQALLDRVGPGIRVRVAPLNVVSPEVASTPYGRRFDQREINARYLQEFERVGTRDDVVWQYPVAVDDGDPSHHPFAAMTAVPASCAG